MRIGSLFTGAGGLDQAVEQFFGAETVWRSDIKPAACKLIDHYWPGTNLGDITTIDWDQVEPVDIITGGFPCTDISLAGKQSGLIRYGDGKTRSGLWAEMCRAINILRPSLVVAENVRALTSATADSNMEPCPWCLGDGPASGVRALGGVLADLADIGYDAAWCGLRAADVGAPHGRFRIFILAWPAADPKETDGTKGGPNQRGSSGDLTLPSAAASLLPTPMTSDHVASTPADMHRNSPQLRAIDRLLPTPSVADGMGGHINRSGARSAELLLPGVAREIALREGVNWGPYRPAIDRWERVFGRPAPRPTVTGPKGGEALSPDLTDWMMGWVAGWTDVPGLTRAQRLSLGGDGVVPAQCEAALRYLVTVPGEVAT